MISTPAAAAARYVDRVSSHSVLSPGDRDALLAIDGRVRQIRAHEDLVVPGGTVDHAILVADGLLARFDTMRNGARQITALHIAGDMCDLHSVAVPRTGWGIVATAASTIVEVPHEMLRTLATTRPGLAMAFWRDTTVDASILAKWVANNGRKAAVARVAHLLCELGMRIELVGLGSRTDYVLPLTQDVLADVTSLTNVHVNRMLGDLRRDGVVGFARPHTRILDWTRLAALAEFTPAYLLRDRPFGKTTP